MVVKNSIGTSQNRLSVAILVLVCAYLLFSNLFFFPKNILSWDVFGYYLYLPLTFIYHDLGIKDHAIIDAIIQKYHNTASFYQAFESPIGRWVMRYSMGMSILYLPFFFAGLIISKIFGFPADGFSLPFQYSIWAGSMIYTFIGIIFLRKILMKFFADEIVALVIIIIALGTNYTMHTVVHGQGAMPHNYLFTLYALIIWFTIRWHETYKMKYALMLAIVCGHAMLSRPSEAVALLIPICWGIFNTGTYRNKIRILKEKIGHVLLFLIVLTAIGFIQFTYWKIYTGRFLFDSYYNPAEGLDLLQPHTLYSLFSFRNGWFIYTPVMIFAVLGFIFLYRRNKNAFLPIFSFFILNLWIVTSWTIWWNGPSFGQRYLIGSYPALAIPIGYFFTTIFEVKNKMKYLLIVVSFICIGLNLFQTWQVANGMLITSRMTKSAYASCFGATKIVEGIERKLLIDPLSPGAANVNESEYSKKKEWMIPLLVFHKDEKTQNATQEPSYFKTSSLRMDSALIFSPNIERRFEEITDKDHAKLKISIQIYCTVDPKDNPGSLVATFEHRGRSYGYALTDVERQNVELNKWTKISFDYLTPVPRNKRDILKVYYWHRGKKPVFIDELKIEVWERNS